MCEKIKELCLYHNCREYSCFPGCETSWQPVQDCFCSSRGGGSDRSVPTTRLVLGVRAATGVLQEKKLSHNITLAGRYMKVWYLLPRASTLLLFFLGWFDASTVVLSDEKKRV